MIPSARDRRFAERRYYTRYQERPTVVGHTAINPTVAALRNRKRSFILLMEEMEAVVFE